MRADGRLPDALAGADDPDRRQLERLECRRVEAKVGADIREAERERSAREPKPVGRPEHGLVGEVDDDLGVVLQRSGQRVDERDAVVLAAAQLLAPADEVSRDELVRQLLEGVRDRREVVLAVDDRERARHERVVTSPSIRAVYFSNARVSVENWMIFSCPWNGYLRHTSTWGPVTSITL